MGGCCLSRGEGGGPISTQATYFPPRFRFPPRWHRRLAPAPDRMSPSTRCQPPERQSFNACSVLVNSMALRATTYHVIILELHTEVVHIFRLVHHDPLVEISLASGSLDYLCLAAHKTPPLSPALSTGPAKCAKCPHRHKQGGSVPEKHNGLGLTIARRSGSRPHHISHRAA